MLSSLLLQVATDALLIRDSCLALAQRHTTFCKHTKAMEVEAQAQSDRVNDLEGQAKALQTELAGSRTTMMELKK